MITRIEALAVNRPSRTELVVFGLSGFEMLNQASKSLDAAVSFKTKEGMLDPEIIDNDGEGHFKVMLRNGVDPVGIMDQNGNVVWFYQPKTDLFISNMAAGDLDRDGLTEFYVATSEGLHKLDHTGKEREQWAKELWIHDVESFVLTEGNTRMLVTTDDQKRVRCYDYQGKLIREIKPRLKAQLYDIERCNWPTPNHILTFADKSLFVIDLDGNVVLKHKLPLFIMNIRGTAVRFNDNQEPWLAVIARGKTYSYRSMLCIFSPKGELAYEELVTMTTGIMAMPLDSSSRREVLLVGDGQGAVYEYKLKENREK